MTQPARPLFHLALRELHAGSGAVFAEADGWSLPMHYAGVREEHQALRTHAVVFDRSQRSRFIVTGTDALDVLRGAFAGHIDDLEEGRAMRTAALNDAGEIRDLVLIARTGGIAYLVTGEAGQRSETLGRLEAAIGPDFDARIDDRTEVTCLVGLAGLAAASVAGVHISEALPGRMKPLHCTAFEFHGFRALGIRTSDTGEDGFEFVLAPAVAQHLIGTMMQAGVPIAGHEALEIARIEACVPSFALDLAPGVTPAEAEIDSVLDIPGGRAEKVLAGLIFEADDALPIGTELSAEGLVVGEVRSNGFSPGLNARIGLGIIDARHAYPGRTFEAAGQRATVVAKPFHRRRSTDRG